MASHRSGPSRSAASGPLKISFPARAWAFLAGPYLDHELAAGISPTSSSVLGARANQITTRRACRTVGQALRRAVEEGERSPSPRLTATVCVDPRAVRACRDDMLALAETLFTIERPCAYGVAIARQLVFDGRSPLFLHPPEDRQGQERRLACTLDAALRALEVSGDFDRWEETPVAA